MYSFNLDFSQQNWEKFSNLSNLIGLHAYYTKIFILSIHSATPWILGTFFKNKKHNMNKFPNASNPNDQKYNLSCCQERRDCRKFVKQLFKKGILDPFVSVRRQQQQQPPPPTTHCHVYV